MCCGCGGFFFFFLLWKYVFDFIVFILILQHCDIPCYAKYYIQIEGFKIKEDEKGQG